MTTQGPTGSSLEGPTTQGPTGYPIGYWLKRLDRAIDGALDATLAAEDLTRRHWQTMNFLHEGPSDAPALADALCRLLDDPELRCRLADAGRRHVEANFDSRVNVRQLREVMTGTVRRPTGVGA